MINFVAQPKAQFFDNNGNPLSGGKVFVYLPGTTTKTNSYPTLADAIALTNANTNPVILDSRGEANIASNRSVKLVITSSTDADPPTTPINTIDNWSLISDTITGTLGNKVLVLTDVANGVNYLALSNASTATSVLMTVNGSDTNAGLSIFPKGTAPLVLASGGDIGIASVSNFTFASGVGFFIVDALATDGSAFRFREGTNNGTNYVGLKAPASIASDITHTLPGSLASVNGQVVTGATTGILSFGTLLGTPATATEQETATSVTAAVTPGVQQRHPSSAKAWCYLTYSTGTPTATASYNIASISDTGTGAATLNLTTAFSSANYCLLGNKVGATTPIRPLIVTNTSASVYDVIFKDDSGTNTDGNSFSAAYGDQ